MQHTSTTRLSTLLLICLFANHSCHACTHTRSWLHRITGIDVCAHVPESGELLKALGVVLSVAIAIRGIQEIEKMITNSLDQDDVEEQYRLPPALHERIFYRRWSAQEIIEEEVEERAMLALDWKQKKPVKQKKLSDKRVYSRPVLYDSTDETMKTGCLILNYEKTTL